jgi:uracil-DNA glycosylase family protein
MSTERPHTKTAPKTPKHSAADYLPERSTLKTLRDAADVCHGCELYKRATQTVFGEGPSDAKLMLVGEVPGDKEDLEGHPFVGPAGRLLDEALEAAGLDRKHVYLTNAVKHFKWEPRGARRLHAKPSAREIKACKPWLEAEIGVVQPQTIVCLGATAAQALLGSTFRLTKHLGECLSAAWAERIFATYHPSAILRAPDAEERARMTKLFVHHLQLAAK